VLASDAPTARLTVLLSRAQPNVYSHDKHLSKPGLVPPPRNLPAVVAAWRQVESGDATARCVINVGGVVVGAVGSVARGAASALRVPDWVTRVSAVGGLGWLLLGRPRRQAFLKALMLVWQAVEKERESASNGLGVLAGAVAPVVPDGRIECRIAEVLARRSSSDALLAKEIQQELAFAAPGAVPSVREIRS